MKMLFFRSVLQNVQNILLLAESFSNFLLVIANQNGAAFVSTSTASFIGVITSNDGSTRDIHRLNVTPTYTPGSVGNGKNETSRVAEPGTCPAENRECVKPNYSYSELVEMAIESAPSKQMLVYQIYKYLADRFEYFRNEGTCWHVNVRHVLSRRSRFARIPVGHDSSQRYIWTLSKYIDTITRNPSLERRKKISSDNEDSAACPPENSSCRKPNYYYWELIDMAINSVPSKRMKLSKIYEYISNNFEYYRNGGDCWRKRIRYTLSTNKRFQKISDEEGGSRRGSYWSLNSQTGNVTRRPASPTTSTQASSHHDQAENATLHTSDYLAIRSSSTFFDKTMWVKTFWATGVRKFVYVTAPPRYGKSTLTSMMRYFFSAKNHEGSGSSQAEDLDMLRKSFEETRIFTQERAFFNKHFQQYPVMFFDFKPLAEITNEATFQTKFCDILCKMYVQVNPFYGDLKDRKHWNECNEECNLDFDQKLIALGKRLSQELFHHYNGSKIIVLIDNYDALVYPLLQGKIGYFDVINTKLTDYLTPLLRENDCIQFSWMTGSFYLGGVMKPTAKMVQHVPFNSKRNWAKYFGVTQDEVRSKLKRFYLSNEEKLIQERYSGYRVENSPLRIYDMVSISNFLVRPVTHCYWNDVTNSFLKLFVDFFSEPRIGTQIEKTITGGSINTLDLKFYWNFTYTPEKLQVLIKRVEYGVLEDSDVTAFFIFLREIGYLSPCGTKNTLLAVSEQTKYALGNMSTYQSTYYTKTRRIEEASQRNFVNAVREIEPSEKSVQKLAKAIFAIFASSCELVTEDRLTYRGPLFAFLAFEDPMKFKWVHGRRVDSTGTSPESKAHGEPDIALVTDAGAGVIFQFQRGRSSMNALQKLVEAEYYRVLSEVYQSTILGAGMYLGVNIDEYCRISISFLCNSTDTKQAKSVMYPP